MTPTSYTLLRLSLALLVPAALLPGSAYGQAVEIQTTECRPEVLRTVRLQAMQIEGDVSGFDPCQRSVEFTRPRGIDKPPLVISLHGGGGKRDAADITRAIAGLGVATLIFDAYQMNGIERLTVMSNFARQKMLLAAGYSAYEWALRRGDIDNRRIYLYGISNGASVVLNLAAMVDPQHVAGVISEAPTPVGIGYPDTLKVPVLIAFGKLDDLGAPPGSKRWQISDPCRFNQKFTFAPPGTADRCSTSTPMARMPTTLEWLASVRTGPQASVSVEYFDEVAHGAFISPLTIRTTADLARARGRPETQPTMGWSEGGTEAGRRTLLQAIERFLSATPPGR